MFKILMILAVALFATGSCYSFCQVETAQYQIFTTPNELQQLPLNKYIRGYNLDFQSSDETFVTIFEPYHVAAKQQVKMKPGYSIINVDGRDSNSHLWGKHGVLFGVGGQNGFAIGYGQFSSGVLPKVDNYNYFDLPYPSNCYSGLIYSSNLDVVVDCEKVAAGGQQISDLVCITSKAGKKTCKSFSSITKTSIRKNVILRKGEQQFLISATLTNHISPKFRNETFINIYRIQENSIQFNLILDRRALGLQTLSIIDIDIIEFKGAQYILLTDSSSKLILFRYNQDNTISDVNIIAVQGNLRQFQLLPEGNWLIANEKCIMQVEYVKVTESINIIKKYELDPSDNKIVDLQSSFLFIAARTELGHFYTYDRKYTELKYLLNKQDITENTAIVVSPYYPRIFQVNTTQMTSISITSGSLIINKILASSTVKITANSDQTTCYFNLKVSVVTGNSKIYQKKSMTSGYKLETDVATKFLLSDFFGGSNLRYNVQSDEHLKYYLEYINTYTPKNPSLQLKGDYLFSKVISVDSSTYWLAIFTTENAQFFKCQTDSNQVDCKQNVNERIYTQRKFLHADGKKKLDGSVQISWTYQNGNQIQFKTMGSNGRRIIIIGAECRFSQVLAGDNQHYIYVEKEVNRIHFYKQEKTETLGKIQTFGKNDFTEAQLKMLGGGFYPRQVFTSNKNPYIFYIKFPISIVTVAYTGGRKLEIISVTKVFPNYIPDNLWEIVIGRQTVLVITQNKVSERIVLADGNIDQLHSLTLNSNVAFPAKYDPLTDTTYFQLDDGTIQYFRMNQPALDSQYYSISKGSNRVSDWDVSGSWLVTNTGQVYYQYPEPTLTITTILPNNVDIDSVSVKIILSSGEEVKEVETKVTAVNFGTKIDKSNAQDNGLILPAKGDPSQIIPFPLQKYFSGPLANFRLICPYCLDGNISLVSPARTVKKVQSLNQYSTIIGLSSQEGSIVLKQNKLSIVDLKGNIVHENPIDFDGECKSLGINEGLLIVFCSSDNQQEVFLYKVSQDKVQYSTKFLLPANPIILKPSELGLHINGGVYTLFIHDVDLMNPDGRQSNVKVYDIHDEVIEFIGQIDSSAFDIDNTVPINSMSILNGKMILTVGRKGIGYLNLDKSKVKGSFIDLQDEKALTNYTLDDTSYLRVIITAIGDSTISALVTTSNSFNYVIEFNNLNDQISFSKILETYGRYGHQKSLNWALVDSRYVMFSFFNQSTHSETLCIYKRLPGKISAFFTAIQLEVSTKSLNPLKSALLHKQTLSSTTSFLFINRLDKPGTPGGLVIYNITQSYGLLAVYQESSSFQLIQAIAFNDYSSESRDLSVEFQGSNSGVKWYSILIVIVLIGIGIAVALGFYLRMLKRRRESKKISLFTEGEEPEQVDQRV